MRKRDALTLPWRLAIAGDCTGTVWFSIPPFAAYRIRIGWINTRSPCCGQLVKTAVLGWTIEAAAGNCPRHREAMATWFASLGVTTDADQLFITHGGQHALSIALGMVAASDDTVLTDSYTYSGMLALSAQSGYRLHGVATDAHGLIPETLDRAFTETRARVPYCMPTLQTPTGSVMPPARRQEIADIDFPR